MKSKFRRRAEQIFKDFDIAEYRECQEDTGYNDGPWVEMTLRPRHKSYRYESCAVPVAPLNKLVKLLRTRQVTVAGWDLSDDGDGTDSVAYVLANKVRFGKGRR